MQKKTAHHEDGEHYDIELICSACIGIGKQKPRILLADPPRPLDEWLVTNQAEKFFRLRHYARIMQFVGATALARQLYLESVELKDFGLTRIDRLRKYSLLPTPEARVRVENEEFLGTYYDQTFPMRSDRYVYRRTRVIMREPIDARIRIFQGIRTDRFNKIHNGAAEDLRAQGPARVRRRTTETNCVASVFADGSIFFAELQR